MSAPISAFVIARDEEERIGRCLEALAWADQILLVDSGSTDATCEIARAHGAEVHQRDWTGYGPQKAHAEALCAHDWILNVDADEVVTPALAGEIQALLATAPPPGAYRIRILNVYPGDAAPRPFAADYNEIRLYHRAVGGYRDHPLFDRVTLTAGTAGAGQLAAPVYHFAHLSLAHLLDKANRYTSYVAETAPPRGRAGLLLRLVFEMPIAFVKFYVFRRHVTGGWKGFVFALSSSFMRMVRIAKLLERQTRRD